MPANTASGRSSPKANHVGVFLGLVSAYSQNEVNGTTHRFSGLSQWRQGGDFVLPGAAMEKIPTQPKRRSSVAWFE